MDLHLFFLFGPVGGDKQTHAILLADTFDQPVRVISIGREISRWRSFPREYELLESQYINNKDYSFSRFYEEIVAGLEKNKDLSFIFPDLLNEDEDLRKIFRTVREVGAEQIMMDFVHLNTNSEGAEISGSSHEKFLERWNNSQQIQKALIDVIKKSNLNIDLCEIDANRATAEVQEDLRRELSRRTTFKERDLTVIPRPELF